MDSDRETMTAAVSAALADPGPEAGELLARTTRMARAVFEAAACSALILDPVARELVFEAVSGEGEPFLVGRRFPADRGLSGWTLATGEPMLVEDLESSRIFARDVAESTGYVPHSIMVVPLVSDGEVLGVLEVLDPNARNGDGSADLETLSLIAEQAGHSMHVLDRGRAARAALATDGGEFAPLASLLHLLSRSDRVPPDAALKLIDALHEIVSALVEKE